METLPTPNRPILNRSLPDVYTLNLGALQNPDASPEDAEFDDERFFLTTAQAVRLRDVLLAAVLPTS